MKNKLQIKVITSVGNRVTVEDSVYNWERISNFLVRDAQVMTTLETNTFQASFINLTKVNIIAIKCIATSPSSFEKNQVWR